MRVEACRNFTPFSVQEFGFGENPCLVSQEAVDEATASAAKNETYETAARANYERRRHLFNQAFALLVENPSQAEDLRLRKWYERLSDSPLTDNEREHVAFELNKFYLDLPDIDYEFSNLLRTPDDYFNETTRVRHETDEYKRLNWGLDTHAKWHATVVSKTPPRCLTNRQNQPND